MRTFPFIFTPLETGRRFPRAPAGQRAFTLIEMMVVVLIITLVATIAVPAVSNRMRSNRTAQAAETLSTIFRTAQSQAMGRGSAVLVRYNAGTFQVLEAIVGATNAPNAGCARLPESSCTVPATRWNAGSDRFQQVDTYDFVTSGNHTVTAEISAATPVATTTLDVCFTPSGRTWSRTDPTAPLVRMNAAATFTVARPDASGFPRVVALSPTGAARVVATP